MHESNLLNFFEMMQLEIETMKFLDMTIKDLGLTIKTTLPSNSLKLHWLTTWESGFF